MRNRRQERQRPRHARLYHQPALAGGDGELRFPLRSYRLLDENTELQLKEVRAILTFRDIPYKGSSQHEICQHLADGRLYRTPEYGILVDEVARPPCLVGDGIRDDCKYAVFGYNEAVPKISDLIRDITASQWMNGISSYSIWWLLIHRDWYYYQGD